jgi:hypothetical protein
MFSHVRAWRINGTTENQASINLQLEAKLRP